MNHNGIETFYDHLRKTTHIIVDDELYYRLGHKPDEVTIPTELCNQAVSMGAKAFVAATQPILRIARKLREKNNRARLLRRAFR